jgi:hypothetical protein
MVCITSCVPCDARCTLWAISLVAAPSSSTAAAPPDHAADAAFKLVGNAGQDGAPILGGAQLHRLPLGPHPRRLGQMILEHLEAPSARSRCSNRRMERPGAGAKTARAKTARANAAQAKAAQVKTMRAIRIPRLFS